MKLEVGKKYVDRLGNVYQVVGVHPKAPTVSIVMGLSNGKLFEYRKNLTRIGDNFNTDLTITEEYVEPKTQDAWVVWYVEGYSGKTMVVSGSDDVKSMREDKSIHVMSVEKVTLTEGEFNE